jgi:hypothetical protein
MTTEQKTAARCIVAKLLNSPALMFYVGGYLMLCVIRHSVRFFGLSFFLPYYLQH